MKQSAWIERSRKRELRVIYRNKRLEYEKTKRPNIKEIAETRAIITKEINDVFLEDNKKPGKPDKKPGVEKFLALYSFIPSTPFDSRYSIPASWKPHSFNVRNQQLEFLKCFVYPYPLPAVLLWASHCPEYFIDTKGTSVGSPNRGFIKLAKKWIVDIVRGESFFKQNKLFFTKTEAHYFLSSKVPYVDATSVIKLYFYAKSRARFLNHKMSIVIADVFTVKFINHFMNSLVEGFMYLLARTPDYSYDRSMLGDISDFVLSKIQEDKKNRGRQEAFSFSGRTITSVIKMTNEWHEKVRREAEAQRVQHAARWREENRNNGKYKAVDTSHWKGLGASQFRYVTEECIWTITELRTAQDLVNEGRKMKNCVASYTYNCAAGNSSIFTMERIFPANQLIGKVATLEVNPTNRTLVQAKGVCNSGLTPKVMSVVIRWTQANRIKTGILV